MHDASCGLWEEVYCTQLWRINTDTSSAIGFHLHTNKCGQVGLGQTNEYVVFETA